MEESDKIFKYYINKRNPKPIFQTHLLEEQCRYIKPDGHHCRRIVVLGIPFCSQHLEMELHLKIRKSTIPKSGKGLFAYDRTRGQNAIIFHGHEDAGDLICYYEGEIINNAELRRRYKRFTAPYGLRISQNRVEDGARIRGVGNYIQHSDDENKINCRFALSNHRIVIFATKNIRNGKELFADYGDDYRFDEPTHYSTR
jgi:hypothetical protein